MAENKLPEKAQKKVKEGWIRSWMMIEVLANSESAAKSALEKHITRMKREKKTMIYFEKKHDIVKVQNPHPRIPEGFSYVIEIELLTENLEQLVILAMTYGPSATEILEPSKLQIPVGEAQAIVNSVAEMIHKFVAAGIGGVVISS